MYAVMMRDLLGRFYAEREITGDVIRPDVRHAGLKALLRRNNR